MIRHLVLFKLKDFSSEDERNEAIEMVLLNFRSLIGEIPQIRKYRVERNISEGKDLYDIIIDSDFDSMEDLRSYQEHPAHRYAVDQNRKWSEKKIVFDYELN